MKWTEDQLLLIEKYQKEFEELEANPSVDKLFKLIYFLYWTLEPGYSSAISGVIDGLITLLFKDKLSLILDVREKFDKVEITVKVGNQIYINGAPFLLNKKGVGLWLIKDFKMMYPFLEIPLPLWYKVLKPYISDTSTKSDEGGPI